MVGLQGTVYLRALHYYPKEGCFCYAFHNHPKAPVGIRQMMAVYRKLQRLGASACCLLSASSYVDDAAAFSRRLGISFTLLGQKALLAFAAQTLPPAAFIKAKHAENLADQKE